MNNKKNNSLLNKYYDTKSNLANYREEFKKIKINIKQTKKDHKGIIKKILSLDTNDLNPELQLIKEHYTNHKSNVISEVFNAISHGLGVIFGIVLLILLIIKARTTVEYIAYSIYSFSFIMLFLASTLYHSLSFTKARKTFKKIDHSSIFVLIAGTYTPYLLITLYNHNGLYYFIGIWTIAVLGIFLKIFFFEISLKIGPILYILMGWLSVFIIKDLYNLINLNAIILLALGGLAYTGGVYFYKKKSMKFSHVIWHLFVLLGAILMFVSIYKYV